MTYCVLYCTTGVHFPRKLYRPNSRKSLEYDFRADVSEGQAIYVPRDPSGGWQMDEAQVQPLTGEKDMDKFFNPLQAMSPLGGTLDDDHPQQELATSTSTDHSAAVQAEGDRSQRQRQRRRQQQSSTLESTTADSISTGDTGRKLLTPQRPRSAAKTPRTIAEPE